MLTIGVVGASGSGEKSGPNVCAPNLGGLVPSLGLGNQSVYGQAQSDGCNEARDPTGLARDDGVLPVSKPQIVNMSVDAGLCLGLKPSSPGAYCHAEHTLGDVMLAQPRLASFLPGSCATETCFPSPKRGHSVPEIGLPNPGHVRSERGSVGGDSLSSAGAVDERCESSPVGTFPARLGNGEFGIRVV
ncbi:hypothetical protein Salat_1091900 [Sesamum alatum]|uniref:Uncharacterized protein n=1 Tax=Sesamum alatum TaxID=300844 RepID=A0AAE2CSU6_9LAMI|nr:hypothetical protein Salat_1091900 [Sesamum alatum]